ncbi:MULTISPECIES: DUF1289 domain-containing protein [Spongiibacter]|uniref:DUF1289 domain-containing protein n=1 Tax=Spongiibacter TaxID=630749 RepID=UPI000C59BA75|nr:MULTISPECIES: DUF1289 domain-containing protein [Spongiibacter]MAY37629.1 DUF1289 domain-containing protein [Spongiibacter sp.]
MSDLLGRVATPCIGVCSTGIGDDVCRGCKRFCHEVINWNSYSQEQKRSIDQRLDRFLVQVMEDKLHIVNAELLAWQLDVQRVRYPAQKAPHIWLFQLLRAGAGQIQEPRKYGFLVDAAWQDQSLLQIREAIDREFYLLSQAHYERYIGRYIQKQEG